MRYLSVCSGIEAATQAWHPLGWTPVAFSEIEPFPSAVLAHHYPHVPNWGDMTKFEDWPDEPIDLLCGGTPCQDYSVAGQRLGMAGARGQLTLTFVEVAARYRPDWLVWENVPGVLSSNGGRDFARFLGDLTGQGIEVPDGGWSNSGIVAGIADAYGIAYRVLDAQHTRTRRFPFAVPQRRRRVWVVGYLGDWKRAAAVLFDRESLSGHPAPRREAGQIAPTIPALSLGGGGLGTDFDRDGGLVAATLDASFGRLQGCSGQDANHGHSHLVAHTLRGEGFDASEDGTGRQNLVTVAPRDVAATIGQRMRGNDDSCADNLLPVAIQERAICENPNAGPGGAGFRQDGTAYTLEARTVPQAVAHPFTLMQRGRAGMGVGCVAAPVAFDLTQITSAANRSIPQPVSPTMAKASNLHTVMPWAVRRLTPRECEALQGFPQLSESVIFSAWLGDKSQLPADAAIQCITRQSSALIAGESAQQRSAKVAAPASSTSRADRVPPVALHVHIDLERDLLQLHKAGRLIWSANVADQSSGSPLLMPIGDFVRLVALTTQTAAKVTLDGKVASRMTERLSSHLWSGKAFVGLSGREIAEHAAVVERFTVAGWKPSMLTTSPSIANIPPSVSTLTTLCCCVLNAIASCIPETISSGSSYSLSIETVSGFTRIPYRKKPADQCPDGPRYKALGNSWAVNCAEWIGERIAMVNSIMEAAE